MPHRLHSSTFPLGPLLHWEVQVSPQVAHSFGWPLGRIVCFFLLLGLYPAKDFFPLDDIGSDEKDGAGRIEGLCKGPPRRLSSFNFGLSALFKLLIFCSRISALFKSGVTPDFRDTGYWTAIIGISGNEQNHLYKTIEVEFRSTTRATSAACSLLFVI